MAFALKATFLEKHMSSKKYWIINFVLNAADSYWCSFSFNFSLFSSSIIYCLSFLLIDDFYRIFGITDWSIIRWCCLPCDHRSEWTWYGWINFYFCNRLRSTHCRTVLLSIIYYMKNTVVDGVITLNDILCKTCHYS